MYVGWFNNIFYCLFLMNCVDLEKGINIPMINKDDYILQVYCINNEVSVTISSNNNNSMDLEYAFYLNKEKLRIQTIWYTRNSMAHFSVKEPGFYQIICFIKDTTDKCILQSDLFYVCESKSEIKNEFLPASPVPISIFGSCVSRDLLEYNPKIFNLKTYIARQSIISAVSFPVTYNIDELSFSSEFQKSRVEWDLEKKTFNLLSKDNSKYLLLDLIDERFSIIKFQNNYITLSNELKSSSFYQNHEHEFTILSCKKIPNLKFNEQKLLSYKYTLENKNIDIYIEDFLKKILSIYQEKNILIHRATLVDYYKDANNNIKKFPNNTLGYNHRTNEYLNYLYDYIINRLPAAFVIDECKNYYANEKHKWGLSPMHYCDEYYQNVNYLIQDYLKNNK